MLEQTDVTLAYAHFEETVRKILDSEAPMKNFQTRTNYNNWIKDSTKEAMEARDNLRELARRTQNPADWTRYRTARNDCTSRIRKDKINSQKEAFKKFETEKDIGKIFNMTRELLNWKKKLAPLLCL